MKSKVVMGVVLTLLLTGVLALAFDIQPVKASGTIYIKADGSIDPPTANITSVDNITYTFTDNNYDEIVVQRSNITVDGGGYTLQGPGYEPYGPVTYGFYLDWENNVTIQNTNIKDFFCGVHIHSIGIPNYNTVCGNNITNNYEGVGLRGSCSNTVCGNNITNSNYAGVYLLDSCDHNTISGNNITNSDIGIHFDRSSFNNISRNNIKDGDTGIFFVDGSNYNTISGNNITNNYQDGIQFSSSSYNTISENNIEDTYWIGISLHDSSNNNTFSANKITATEMFGIELADSSNSNTFSGNNITNNGYIFPDWGFGVALYSSANNRFYHNNFIDNNQQVYINMPGYPNVWDDGYPSGGNYWSDYTGVDIKCGPGQDQPGSDGICDTSYGIDENNVDEYPLMNPVAGTYALTVTTTTGGTTNPSPGTHIYRDGISKSVRALPEAYYVLDHWELDGSWNYSDPISVTMDSNHTLHAVFKYSPIPYNVTIEAHCYSEGTNVSVSITMDGSPTGYNTSHTFTNLTDTHTFTVPSADSLDHLFKQWDTGETSTTITVTSAGTYTAYYQAKYTLTITTTTGGTTNPWLGTHKFWDRTSVSVTAIPNTGFYFDHWELDGSWNYSDPISVTMDSNHTLHAVFKYNVTIEAHCYSEGTNVSVSITMDGSPTGYNTSHTFTNLTDTHTFTVPSADPNGHQFIQWGTGETSTTLTVTTGGTYTTYYGTYDVAVTNVTLSKTAVMQGCCVNITVTVENQGNFIETFGVAAPYFDGVVIPTSVQWETFWRMGDVTGDGRVDDTDEEIMDYVYAGFITDPMWVRLCDLNGDGKVTLSDVYICDFNQGKDIWTHFGLPLPPIGTQKGVRLLDPGNQTTLTFTWNTTGVPNGTYTITAAATQVQGETNTTDNTYTDGWVEVRLRGDVNDDGKVSLADVGKLDLIFSGWIPEPYYPPYVPDINGDGAVTLADVGKLDLIFSGWL